MAGQPTPHCARRPERAAPAILSVAFVSLCLIHALFGYYFVGQTLFAYGNDDAFISYRYALNLVETGELTFNPGESPPVEGFSNPLHVALSAGVIALLGTEGAYPVMAALGVLAMLGAILLTFSHLSALTDRRTALYGGWALALIPAFWIHASSGLETSLTLLMQVTLWITLAGAAPQAPMGRAGPVSTHAALSTGSLALACAATVLLVGLRTDGFVVPVIAAAWLLVVGRPGAAAAIVGTAVAAFLCLMAARLAYYGLPMPLTFYAKISGDLLPRFETAARYYGSIFLKGGLALPFLAMAVLAVAALRALPKGLAAFRAAIPLHLWLFAGLSAYYAAIGGDIYRERFLLLLFATGAVAAFTLAHRRAPCVAPPLFAVAIALHALVVGAMWDRRLDYVVEFPKYDQGVRLGRHLAEAYPGALLASTGAGKLPFYSSLETIDMLGLNDRHIAMTEARNSTPGHSKWDTDYILSRAPDLICGRILVDGGMPFFGGRDIYAPRGYTPVVLVRERWVRGPDLLDPAGMTGEEFGAAIAAGYTLGCLSRPD
ncbi:MAG: hypothetical protein V2I65_09330 [Paracoccaceae bacterium]|nr:hypothetical protein [Paracoccaceae bacterium]